jgi:hypothetical protein
MLRPDLEAGKAVFVAAAQQFGEGQDKIRRFPPFIGSPGGLSRTSI